LSARKQKIKENIFSTWMIFSFLFIYLYLLIAKGNSLDYATFIYFSHFDYWTNMLLKIKIRLGRYMDSTTKPLLEIWTWVSIDSRLLALVKSLHVQSMPFTRASFTRKADLNKKFIRCFGDEDEIYSPPKYIRVAYILKKMRYHKTSIKMFVYQ
jgi:hypothetical protein